MTGAVRNGIEEKSINLDIVLALKEQLDSYSGDKRLGIFYTRTTDTNLHCSRERHLPIRRMRIYL